ncbi:MAG: TetR/AcrR family transcriptional regulator, partial [Microbacteriaceae bacterium]|nr:TetR/AcrR family transcriptional regulator [Microbacteriaceae bacterium]
MTLHEQLRDVALDEFATAGYAGTSLQRIADLAGTSKASVLYHYDSKERLLEAAISPAVDDLRGFVDGMGIDTFAPEKLPAFVEQFVDVLLAHRQVVHFVINQGATLEDVPVVHRALEQMRRLAEYFELAPSST